VYCSSIGSSIGTRRISQQGKILRTCAFQVVLFFIRLQGARPAPAKRAIFIIACCLTESGKFQQFSPSSNYYLQVHCSVLISAPGYEAYIHWSVFGITNHPRWEEYAGNQCEDSQYDQFHWASYCLHGSTGIYFRLLVFFDIEFVWHLGNVSVNEGGSLDCRRRGIQLFNGVVGLFWRLSWQSLGCLDSCVVWWVSCLILAYKWFTDRSLACRQVFGTQRVTSDSASGPTTESRSETQNYRLKSKQGTCHSECSRFDHLNWIYVRLFGFLWINTDHIQQSSCYPPPLSFLPLVRDFP
jgi:hypothetical protein